MSGGTLASVINIIENPKERQAMDDPFLLNPRDDPARKGYESMITIIIIIIIIRISNQY